MNFRDFVEQTRDGLEHVAFGLEGERSIAPMFHLESESGIHVVTADRELFVGPDPIRGLVERWIVPLAQENRARKVAWTFCAWVTPDAGERREMLMATFIDPEVVEHWAAPIVRTLGRVVIGRWMVGEPNAGGGPAITAIQEAIR